MRDGKILLAFFVMNIFYTAASAADRLLTYESLANGSFISSPNGKYSLIMQTDGSLVMYRSNGTIRYRMAKHGEYALMQPDGNFVEYYKGTALWASDSFCGCPWPPYLRILDDGDLRIEWRSPSGNMEGGIWGLGPDPLPPGGATTAVQNVTVPGGPPPPQTPAVSFPDHINP